jgi:GNAT superfamily N-acetyltransferase
MYHSMNATPPQFRFRTRRGEVIGVRQPTLEDTGLLAALLADRSECALQPRYLAVSSAAGDKLWCQAARLVQARPAGHFTFIATRQRGECEEAIGIATLLPDWYDASIGEASILVHGDIRQQGIGSSLFWRLVYAAQRSGMAYLSARMTEENMAMLRLIHGLKLGYTAITRSTEVRVLVSLPGRHIASALTHTL